MKNTDKVEAPHKKFDELIGQLSQDEITKLEKDIECGGWMLRNLISEHKKRKEHQDRICAMCGLELKNTKDFLTLQFGSLVRMQAHFCAADCLLYFLEKRTNLNLNIKK